MLYCNECSWSGEPDELVALTDAPEDREFTHCPQCDGISFDEEESFDDYDDIDDYDDSEWDEEEVA